MSTRLRAWTALWLTIGSAAWAAPYDTTLISRASDADGGAAANAGRAVDPAVAADGRYVAFSSDAGNLAGGGVWGFCPNVGFRVVPQIYVRDTLTGTTTLASRADGVAGAPSNGCAMKPAISPDGRWVVFEAAAERPAATEKVRRRCLLARSKVPPRRGVRRSRRTGATSRSARRPTT